MSAARRKAIGLVGVVAAMLALAFVALAPASAAEADKGIVAGFISRALSSRTTTVSIGAVDGAFSSDATIRDIVLSDRDGPWLKIDTVRLVWTQSALLTRRLLIDQLTIGHLDILRRPTPPPPDPKAPKLDPNAILPDLPVKVIVKTFAVQTLSLGETLVGTKASLSLSGSATLGPPSEGLDLKLDAKRLDAEGKFVARLGFVPKSTDLTLGLDFEEPANGLLATFAGIPGRPPVKLALHGAGPLDAFRANLDFAAGADIGAKGEFHLTREGPGRRLGVTLDGQLAKALPPLVAGAFADPSNLQGDLFLGDDGAIDIKSLHFVTASSRLDVEGAVAADRRIDLHVHAGAIPGAKDIGKLDLNADFHGPLASLEAQAHLEAASLRSPLGEVGTATASFTLKPDGALTDGSTRFALAGDAAYSGLALVDPAQQALFGAEAKLTFRAQTAAEGGLHVAAFALDSATLKAGFAGDVGAKLLHGQLTADAPDLTRLAWLSPLPLHGGASLAAALDGAPDQGVYSAALDLKTREFHSGVAALDGFAGAAPTLTGSVRSLAAGGFGFDNLTVTGEHGTARVAGTLSGDAAAVHVEAHVPEMKYLDPRVAGEAALVGDLTGSLAHLNVGAKADLTNGRLLDRPAPRLEFSVQANDVTGRLDATGKLDGEIDSKPASGAFSAARTADGGWRLSKLDLGVGSARLQGEVYLSSALRASGQLSLNAARLDDLSPLLLTRLSGSIQSEIKLTTTDSQQDIAIAANSPAFSVGAASVANLAVNLTLLDVYLHPRLEGAAGATRIAAGGEAVADLKLVAKASAADSDIDLTATARGLAWSAHGVFAPEQDQLRLSELAAQGKGHSLRLTKPVALGWGEGKIAIDDLNLSADSGRLTLAGTLGSQIDLRATAAALPLALADLVSPGLDLQGAATGEAALKGTATAPEGDWRLRLENLSAPALRAAALKPLKVEASGRLSGGRTALDATISAPSAGSLRVTGSAPLGASGDLALKAAGRLDLAGANDLLGASGQRATGVATLNAELTGPLAHPNARGALNISGASFSDDAHGVRLTSIEGALTANGDEIQITRLHAATPQGGAIDASGRIKLDAAAGFPGAVHLTGRRAQLVSTDIVTAVANLSLDLDGALARNPKISGRIDLQTLEITIPGSLSGDSRPLAGMRHIAPGPTARARLAMAAREGASGKAAAPFDAALALTISAPNRVFVRGRGVDAELSGDVRVGGTTRSPEVSGGFDLRRGALTMLGNQLSFTRGRAEFHGDTTPDLDFLAQTTAGDVTAYVAVTGPASKPVFAFTSDPSLPQDEILSRILFQKPSGNLSAFQALQLANAAASLTGRGDAFENIRKSLGVDSFNVSTGSNGGPVVGVQRAINNRLSLGVKSGSRPEDNGVTLDLDVTRHLRVQGGVDAKGGSTAGVGVQYEY